VLSGPGVAQLEVVVRVALKWRPHGLARAESTYPSIGSRLAKICEAKIKLHI